MSPKRSIHIVGIVLLMLASTALYGGTCSLESLNGSYGWFGVATLTVDPPLRMVEVGIINFDGAGHSVAQSTANAEGWGAGEPGSAATGAYTVNPDCSYTGDLTGDDGVTYHFTGTIIGSGITQETRYVLTDPEWVNLGTLKKISAKGCSAATLKGSYALFGDGTLPQLDASLLIAHVGSVTYDGLGQFGGSDTIMMGDVAVPDTFTGSYTVTAECMIKVEISSTAVGVVHELGWITGEGKSTEVHLIVTDPGFIFAETSRKQ